MRLASGHEAKQTYLTYFIVVVSQHPPVQEIRNATQCHIIVQALWHFFEALWRQFDDFDSMAGAHWLHLPSEAWKHWLVAAEMEISQTPGVTSLLAAHPQTNKSSKSTNISAHLPPSLTSIVLPLSLKGIMTASRCHH